MDGPGNGRADTHESQPLLGSQGSSSERPLWEHENPVVRWPMFTLHKTCEVLASNYVNVLLIFVPAGIITGALGINPTAVFILNFLAIIPLASLLSFATEELAAKLGQTIGGLLNATFGNAVELIVSILALTQGQIRIVQSSMLGSILSNILLLKTHSHLFDEEQQQDGGDNQKEPEILSPVAAGVALVVVTIMVAVCADYLVDSIDSIVEASGISKTFIGLVLLPIVGNAAEHVTACVVAYKDKMDLAIGVAIGSSMQIALFVTPFLVILGWIIDKPMTLHFQTFETVVFFLGVLVVNYLIQDGKSNYLEGCMCLGTYVYANDRCRNSKLTYGRYIIIALAFFVYPDDAGDSMLNGLFSKHT
ncbi:MAG: hypothetical protein Q9165_001985 [Trypethelium subeluteriae]